MKEAATAPVIVTPPPRYFQRAGRAKRKGFIPFVGTIGHDPYILQSLGFMELTHIPVMFFPTDIPSENYKWVYVSRIANRINEWLRRKLPLEPIIKIENADQ